MKDLFGTEEVDDEQIAQFEEMKIRSKKKRWANRDWSLNYLREQGIEYEVLNESCAHYRIKGVSFWPTTGKYHDPKTGKSGRGVKELIEFVNRIESPKPFVRPTLENIKKLVENR